MEERYPGVLWLPPIFWGFTGGIIASIIARCVYRDSWWELFVVGILTQAIYLLAFYFLIEYTWQQTLIDLPKIFP